MNNNPEFKKIKEALEIAKNYDVGYGKPPKNTQFRKGVSGNPRGRKKKIIPKTLEEAIKLELNRETTISNSYGTNEKVSFYQILARKIVQDSIKNDGPTRKLIMQSRNILKCDFPEMIKDLETRNKPDSEDSLTPEQNVILHKYLYEIANDYYRSLNNP